MILGRSALFVVAAAVALTTCVDPVTPRSGTATLDDPGAGAMAAVTAGREHGCALTAPGDAWCWGSNEFGQLGAAPGTSLCARLDRSVPCARAPRAVSGGLKFQRIAAGGSHSCGVATDGRIYCWGDNQYGQLGNPAVAIASTPIPALTSSLFTDVVTGGAHTCGLRTDGALVCWGANDRGQLGIATAGTGSAVPAVSLTNLRFASLSAGENRTCGRVSDGTTYCWGSQWVARASDGMEVTRSQAQPLRVAVAPAFRQLSVGGQTTCALALDGAAWCWEANPTGALGDGSTLGSTWPQPVKTTRRFTSITVGAQSACGIADSGHVFCWGSGQIGQLGVPSATVSKRCDTKPCALSPIQISGWRTFSALAAGMGEHVCGLTLTGSVYCWGAGSMGQRGDGTAAAHWSPTRVPTP